MEVTKKGRGFIFEQMGRGNKENKSPKKKI